MSIQIVRAIRRGRPFLIFLIAASLLIAACTPTPSTPLPPKTPTPLILIQTIAPHTAVPATITPTPAPVLGDHIIGPDKAFLTIVMYGDFQCTLCLDVARSIEILREQYAADIRLIWRNFPQSKDDDKALIAAQAAESAAAQGKFWEMHDQLFTHQSEWSPLSADEFRAKLSDYAVIVGLDAAKFSADMLDSAITSAIQSQIEAASALDLKGVPVLLFNGQPYSGRIDLYALDAYTRLQLLAKRWYKSQPALQIDVTKHYTATLVTAKGTIEIDLDAKAAPVAVNNFIALARDGWYNAITFHLVLPGTLVQTGDPSGSGFGGPGYTIFDESTNGLIFDQPGQVAMASERGKTNSAGSQFFIALAPLRPAAQYDGQFTIFGHVSSGLDVLAKLTPRNPFDELNFPSPPPGDKLVSVTIHGG